MWIALVVGATPPRGVGGDVNVPCDSLTLLMLRHAGVGVGWGGCQRSMWLALVVDATPRRGWGGVGGDVNVPCDLLSLLVLRHPGGVGGDVNVPCDSLTLLMLRHAGVGVGWGGCQRSMWLALVVDATPRRGWGGGRCQRSMWLAHVVDGTHFRHECSWLDRWHMEKIWKIPHTLDMSVIKGVKFKTKKRDDLL